ncbi:MAG: DNRLRE domain-containing protein [Anaerolineae bacterium]
MTIIRCRIALAIVLALAWGTSHTLPLAAQDAVVRRVYAPLLSETEPWAEAGIFWFGRVDPPGAPGQNYVDVRVGYTSEKLRLFVNVQDYYLWYDADAGLYSDLTRYDAVAITLDTAHDRAAAPQVDDYLFFSGMGYGSLYQRQARGTGVGWDSAWQGGWDARPGAGWSCNPGVNTNSCDVDFGWWSFIDIPWNTLGRSGPPPEGEVWGLGVVLYDRDNQPPAGEVPPEQWPEAFEDDRPSTWGELAFGLASYAPPLAVAQGTTVIQRGLGESIVEDAWVGGGGTCSGGHEGDPDQDNHGGDTSLFVENQSLIADFPCFSKSYLRFRLDDIPPGKTIISASLRLHHWGNANPSNAQPSLIQLFTVDGDWGEYDLTWNNAPLARENLTATWVGVCTPAEPCEFPGVPYEWDATQAVAAAYAAGTPLNVALYTADTNFDSSKYLSSSEVGDWNAEARPMLTVVWGSQPATVEKTVWPAAPFAGQTVTYTLSVVGSGEPITLTDDLPDQLSAPGAMQVSPGYPAPVYDQGDHRLIWSDAPAIGDRVTLTFPVTVQAEGPLVIANVVTLTDGLGSVSTDTALLIVNARQVWLPLTLRDE